MTNMTTCDMFASPSHEIGAALFTLHSTLVQLALLQRDYPELVARDHGELLTAAERLSVLCWHAGGMKHIQTAE